MKRQGEREEYLAQRLLQPKPSVEKDFAVSDTSARIIRRGRSNEARYHPCQFLKLDMMLEQYLELEKFFFQFFVLS